MFNICYFCEHFRFDEEKRVRRICAKGHWAAPSDGRCPDLKMKHPEDGGSVKVLQKPQKEYGACRKAVIRILKLFKEF